MRAFLDRAGISPQGITTIFDEHRTEEVLAQRRAASRKYGRPVELRHPLGNGVLVLIEIRRDLWSYRIVDLEESSGVGTTSLAPTDDPHPEE